MPIGEPAPPFLGQSVAYPPSLPSPVGMDVAATNVGVHGVLQLVAGISSQDHYHRQPIDPDSQEGGTSSILQDPTEIFIIALTRVYLGIFLPQKDITNRQVEFLIQQARAASRNEF